MHTGTLREARGLGREAAAAWAQVVVEEVGSAAVWSEGSATEVP